MLPTLPFKKANDCPEGEEKKKKGGIPSPTIKDLIRSKIPVFSLRTGSFFAVVND